MTQDEIIEMATQVYGKCDWHKSALLRLEAFVKLVEDKATAKEREACAEIAEKQRYAMCISLTSHPAQNGTAVGIANTIRARGEACT
jgi:hypothetical protein